MQAAMTAPALLVDGVSHLYGVRRALDNVSFSVPAGGFCALLGPNGAGKSTLFALITRLYSTQSGSIAIFGHDVGHAPGEALRRLGVVFQARTLDLDLTVEQNLIYHAALHGMGGRKVRERSDLVLAQLGMGERARNKARDLSGGQMRRVEIARALLHEPPLLLLDEPTVGLDLQARGDILAHVRRLAAQTGIGVLWTTHLLDEVDAEDQVVVLHRGKALDQGLASEVAARQGAKNITGAFIKLTGLTAFGEAA